MISAIKVLNSVTTLGTDVSVSSDGIVNVASVATVDAYDVRNVSVTVPQAEVSGVVTVTPQVFNLTVYSFYINAFSMSTGLPKVVNVSFVSSSGADATSISNQARAIINADSDLSVIASGTATIVLTAKPTQPFFVVGGTTANIDSYSGASSTIIFSGVNSGGSTVTILEAANTGGANIAGKAVRGSVAYLQNKYAYSANGNALNYNELALLTSGFFYTEVVISYISTTPSGSGAFKGEISTLEAVVLVRANTDGSSSVFTTTNYADLLGSYGTVTGLAAGYRVTGAALTSAITAGALNSTTQVQTVTGALATVDVVGGDYLVSVSTPVVSKVLGVLSNTTYVSSNTTALTSGSTLNVFRWRNLPA
jgi:hypothetical protein